MKWILPSLLTLAIALAAFAVTGCNKSGHDHGGGSHAHQYSCPMKEHSDVVSDKPGNCPKCGMKLVEKK